MNGYAVEIIRGIEINTNKPYLMPFQILLKILNNKKLKRYSRYTIAVKKLDEFDDALEIYKANVQSCRTVKSNNKIIADLIYIWLE